MLINVLSAISIFLFGVVVGFLIHKEKIIRVEHEVEGPPPKGKAQFFEPITTKEKFKEAKIIDDLLEP